MRVEQFNIFDFQHPRLALIHYLDLRQSDDSSFSLRKWSREMSLNGHSLLALQLQGKRKVGLKHIEHFSKNMGLTANEKQYFKGITIYSRSKTEEEKSYHLAELIKLTPNQFIKSKEVDQFKLIADYVHMAIMALSDIDNIILTEKEIRKRLGHKFTNSEIVEAIERLIDLGLLKKENDILTTQYGSVFTKNDIPDEGVKEYHRQTSQLAKEAIDEVDLESREFQSFSIAVPADKVKLAKEMIRKFRTELCMAVGGHGENIYQTNIQFFQLSRNPDQKGVREFEQDNLSNLETGENR